MIKAVVGANWGDEGKGKITESRTTVQFFPVTAECLTGLTA